MKAGFGLVALLVVMAIVFILWTMHTGAVAEKSKPARERAAQWAGQDDTGMKAKDSIVLDPQIKNGKIIYVVVEAVHPGGPMEKYFGLRQGDLITKVVERGVAQHVREMDPDSSKDFILQAYTTEGKLVVLRDGAEVELPQSRPAAGKSESSDPINRQLDVIPGVR